MLEELTIKDFALIDSDYLEFNRGLTVLSGETGAGKSILIGAISFLLGGKADVSQIRTGSEEATVTGCFYLGKNPEKKLIEDEEIENAWQWLENHGIAPENDRIICRRYIKINGKSATWIGDTPVTRNDLAQFSSFLIDIHGQHEHQSLMRISEHRKFLDIKAGIVNDVNDLTKLYTTLVNKRKELSNLISTESDREHKLEMYSFAVKEISDAKLLQNEDEKLEQEEIKLSSYEKIFSDLRIINDSLNSTEESVSPILKKIRKEASQLAQMDKSLAGLSSRLESAYYEISDIAEEYSQYEQRMIFDPSRLQEIQDRLSLIYNLKKKYTSSVNSKLQELFDYLQEAQNFINDNSSSNSIKAKLASEISTIENEVLQKAIIISKKRQNASVPLSHDVEEILSKLGMAGTKFSVSITQKTGSDVEQKCGPYGIDEIEFMISANPGSPLLPLAKIASGGELSRVMLALKTIFAISDQVDTLIFDEIDTGIGGEVAVAIGSHLKNLAKNKQIFCITHLASIAVYADNQIKIEKSVSDKLTSSNVYEVKGDKRVQEIARMLSGDSDSGESIEHARTMLKKYSGDF